MNQPALFGADNSDTSNLSISDFLKNIESPVEGGRTALVKAMNTNDLVMRLTQFNDAFRSGEQLISDHEYDHVWLAELQSRFPDGKHPYLESFESEPESAFAGAKKIKHPIPMLSTDKAYTVDEIKAFVRRIEKAAIEIGIDPTTLTFMATEKIDGMALRQKDGIAVTRGESKAGAGFEITSIFDFGVQPAFEPEGSLSVIGELACDREYFADYLDGEYADERAVVTGFASACARGKTPADAVIQAAKEGAIHIAVYDKLTPWMGSAAELISGIDDIYFELTGISSYLTDGIVVEVTNEAVKAHMGHNSTNHRWQIAKKIKGEMKEITILGHDWQTSRVGRVSPVIVTSGATFGGRTIERPTGHSAKLLVERGHGIGAKAMAHFAGGVIPALEPAHEPVAPVLPTHCNCCDTELEWEPAKKAGEEPTFLRCPNIAGCSAQAENRLQYFFKTHGDAKGFGAVACRKLVEFGITDIPSIYRMTKKNFLEAGISTGVADNLLTELDRSLKTEVKAENVIAGLGIHFLGRGQSRRMLEHYSIYELDTVTTEGLMDIAGFGDRKSPSIAGDLAKNIDMIKDLLSLGFTMKMPMRQSDLDSIESPIKGKGVVFTGTLESASRKELQDQCRELGGIPQGSVTSKTTWLVCGSKVGEKKVTAARAKGVKDITESEYLAMIGGAA